MHLNTVWVIVQTTKHSSASIPRKQTQLSVRWEKSKPAAFCGLDLGGKGVVLTTQAHLAAGKTPLVPGRNFLASCRGGEKRGRRRASYQRNINNSAAALWRWAFGCDLASSSIWKCGEDTARDVLSCVLRAFIKSPAAKVLLAHVCVADRPTDWLTAALLKICAAIICTTSVMICAFNDSVAQVASRASPVIEIAPEIIIAQLAGTDCNLFTRMACAARIR